MFIFQKLDKIHVTLDDKLHELVELWKSGKPLGLPVDPQFSNKNKKLLRILSKKSPGDLDVSKSLDEFNDSDVEESNEANEDNQHMLLTEDNRDDSDDDKYESGKIIYGYLVLL